jgi:hypothetical protein
MMSYDMLYDITVRPQHAEVLITYTCCVVHLINPTHNVLLGSRFTPDWDIGFSVDGPPKAVSHSRHTIAAASFFSFFVILIYYYPLAIPRKPPSKRNKKINCCRFSKQRFTQTQENTRSTRVYIISISGQQSLVNSWLCLSVPLLLF